MSAYVVSGATGNTGSVTAAELLARGERVKAITREAARAGRLRERGAEVAEGSVGDREFLSKALQGAEAFYAVMPPDTRVGDEDYHAAQRRTADAMAAAVKQSGVAYVVMLSSQGADLPSGTGPIQNLHYLENALRGTGAKVAAIRAGYFQENIAGMIGAAREAGIYPNFLGGGAVPMIATRDIGRLAAELLTSPARRSEAVDLLGPEYTAQDLSRELETALGKPVQVVDIPAAGHVDAMVNAGIPRALAETYAEMYAAVAAGRIVPKGDRLVKGTTAIREVLKALVSPAAQARGV
jgi:uncharacterized protein YbjT (DUF2867 family)